MITFLFWNMGGASPPSLPPNRVQERRLRLRHILANLASVHEVDLLMLAECPLQQTELLAVLNARNRRPFRQNDPRSVCGRIALYPRFSARYVLRRSESELFTSRLVRLPGREEFVVFVAHLRSKMYSGEESQSQGMPGFSEMIRSLEKAVKHQKTLLVGDLNMNPFETGIVSAQGMNAVMTREIALRGSRTLEGKEHPFFYNPMWSHFGDSTHDLRPPTSPDHEPPGTCYYPAAESKWFFWNMFDQVLLRPALVPFFNPAELKILVTDGETSFLNARGLPDRALSDHLPLLFRLNL